MRGERRSVRYRLSSQLRRNNLELDQRLRDAFKMVSTARLHDDDASITNAHVLFALSKFNARGFSTIPATAFQVTDHFRHALYNIGAGPSIPLDDVRLFTESSRKLFVTAAR